MLWGRPETPRAAGIRRKVALTRRARNNRLGRRAATGRGRAITSARAHISHLSLLAAGRMRAGLVQAHPGVGRADREVGGATNSARRIAHKIALVIYGPDLDRDAWRGIERGIGIRQIAEPVDDVAGVGVVTDPQSAGQRPHDLGVARAG